MKKTVATAVGVVALMVCLVALTVQFCWNFVIPEISALPRITFLQAAILTVLVRALVGERFEMLPKLRDDED